MQQVGQGGVAELVLAEVDPQRALECVDADVRAELFEHARPLGVRNSVEVDLDRVQVGNVGGDGMC